MLASIFLKKSWDSEKSFIKIGAKSNGIDSKSILRAIVINIINLGYEQGFSSLTQQVARTLYDTIGFKKTITRKIKEIITAIQIERTYRQP